MNPVLLKPQSEIGAQIVVQGRVYGSAKAAAYQHMKRDLLPSVLDSFERLRSEADIVLVEGAGSAAEVNLRANDIANMGFARAADVPVVLIGDIDRGGVIASLVGTKAVIAPDDAALICGFIVNKFRGDPALFAAGMERIAQADRLGGARPCAVLCRCAPAAGRGCAGARASPCRPKPNARVRIAVPILPHIANFDDLDPLDAEPAVDLVRVRPGAALPGDADLICCPARRRPSPILRRCAPPASISISPRIGAAAACSRPLRRLSDAGPHDRRSGRHRRAAGDSRWPRPARCRDDAVRRQALEPVRGTTSDGVPFCRLRDAYGRDRRARIARGRLRGSPTARPTARSRPTAG